MFAQFNNSMMFGTAWLICFAVQLSFLFYSYVIMPNFLDDVYKKRLTEVFNPKNKGFRNQIVGMAFGLFVPYYNLLIAVLCFGSILVAHVGQYKLTQFRKTHGITI